MEATRVTIDEISERIDRGEQFTFVDHANAEAGPKLRVNCPARFACRPTS